VNAETRNSGIGISKKEGRSGLMLRARGHYRLHRRNGSPEGCCFSSSMAVRREISMNSIVRSILGLLIIVFGGLLALKIFGFIVAMAVGIFFHLLIYALAIVGLLAILAAGLYLLVPGGDESEKPPSAKKSSKNAKRESSALPPADFRPSADNVAAELRRQREELRRTGRE
jgi:hypothetical protein